MAEAMARHGAETVGEAIDRTITRYLGMQPGERPAFADVAKAELVPLVTLH